MFVLLLNGRGAGRHSYIIVMYSGVAPRHPKIGVNVMLYIPLYVSDKNFRTYSSSISATLNMNFLNLSPLSYLFPLFLM